LPVVASVGTEYGRQLRIVAGQQHERARFLAVGLRWQRRVVRVAAIEGVFAVDASRGDEWQRRARRGRQCVCLVETGAVAQLAKFLSQAKSARQLWMQRPTQELVH